MAEDMLDMMLYGDHCQHGVNVGTPGGIDLMCGYCESGFTEWVEDPQYALIPTINGSYPQESSSIGLWSEAYPQTPQQFKRMFRQILRYSKLHAMRLGIDVEFQVIKTQDGYWDEPVEVASERSLD